MHISACPAHETANLPPAKSISRICKSTIFLCSDPDCHKNKKNRADSIHSVSSVFFVLQGFHFPPKATACFSLRDLHFLFSGKICFLLQSTKLQLTALEKIPCNLIPRSQNRVWKFAAQLLFLQKNPEEQADILGSREYAIPSLPLHLFNLFQAFMEDPLRERAHSKHCKRISSTLIWPKAPKRRIGFFSKRYFLPSKYGPIHGVTR